MNNVIEVNQNIVYVKGAFRGAIYNFSNGNVYSINNDACKIIEEFIDNQRIDKPYLVELEKMGLINADFSPKEYRFSKIEKELNFVWLELTEACNLRCLHCYDGDEHKDNFSEKLSFEQFIYTKFTTTCGKSIYLFRKKKNKFLLRTIIFQTHFLKNKSFY